MDNFKLVGDVDLYLHDADGKLIEERHGKNLVVTAGKGFVTSRMIGTATSVISHMALGTNNAAAAASQTTLTNETGRVGITSAVQSTTDVTNDTVTYSATFGAGVSTGALVEQGLFNASSGGVMLSRMVFAAINKSATDSLTVVWKIKVA